jgi:biopolymer transport protein ExbD
MARHKRHHEEEEKEPALDISSLIDVCFLLLIYFLVTSTIKPRETDLGMALPAATPSEEQPKMEPLFIRIDASGAISEGTGASQQVLDTDVGDRNLPLLSSRLQIFASAAKSGNDKPLVQIWADPAASQQRVVDVLNALAGVGISSVTFTDLVDS